MAALSLHQEQILNQERGAPVPERNLESLQDGGMIPSFCQDENLSTKRVFLPHPLDCGLFCTSTSRDFFFEILILCYEARGRSHYTEGSSDIYIYIPIMAT